MGGERPRRRRISSLRSRLLFLICLATLPAVLFAFFAAQKERTSTIERTARDALHLARLMAREHVHQIQGARSLLVWLGDRLAREGDDSPILGEPDLLRALLAGHPQLANVGVLTPEGDVRVSAHPVPEGVNWRNHPAFEAALGAREPVPGTYLISPIFGRPTLNHAYAVRDAGGRVTSVLFSGLNLSWLSDLAREASRLEQPMLLLLDREGRVVASGSGDVPEGTDLGLEDVAAMARSGAAHTVLLGTPPASRFLVVAPLQDLPGIHVAVGLPEAEVLGWSRAAFYRTLAGLGLLTLFTILAVYAAAEIGVLRSLRALAHTVRRFGGGDLAARAKTAEGCGETDALAHAFNAMADDLAARHREALRAEERMRALARHAQTAREEEAARISRELHDEIGQLLTSLRIDLARLPARCAAPGARSPCAEALEADVQDMNRRLLAALDFVRRIAAELRPAVLDRLGLVEALGWLGRQVESRTGIPVHVDAERVDPAPAEGATVALFRIAQEALTNVVRHAGAGHAAVSLRTEGDRIVLEVRDDGRGLPPEALGDPASLGLSGMRERAALAGGSLEVAPAEGGGTMVRATVPRGGAATHADPAR